MYRILSRSRIVFASILALLGLSLLGSAGVSAHESRTVATDYEFVVGFVNEPAISEEANGVLLEVTKADAPVEGLADTLQVKVIFGDQSKDMVLTPIYNTPGAYEAVFIPTAPGDYTFQFTGMIEGVAVDETFTSSPEGFDSVADRTELEFPVSANGSTDDQTLAMPFAVGAVVLLAGGAFFIRRRAELQSGQ